MRYAGIRHRNPKAAGRRAASMGVERRCPYPSRLWQDCIRWFAGFDEIAGEAP